MDFCYYFLKDDIVKAMCSECHLLNKSIVSWQWNGGVFGYGDNDIMCSICGKTIYKHEEIQTDI